MYTDAIDLDVTSRQTTSKFGTSSAELIAGIIHGAVSEDVMILNIRLGG